MMNELMMRLRACGKYVRKYKYTLLILIMGIVLMCVPIKKADEEKIVIHHEQTPVQPDLKDELELILSQINGVGAVRVMLTLDKSEARELQQDTYTKTSPEGTEVERETVLASAASDDVPVEIVKTYPTYRGALVVCQGADKASVKLDVVRAVNSLTGLGADQIAVIKMRID